MNDRYEIEKVAIPGIPGWRYRVAADRVCGPKFKTRVEAEKRRDQLLRKG